MPTPSLSTLITLTEDAYERHPVLSIIANLRDLREEDWTALPPGGARSRPHEELVEWMTEGHRRWVESLKALNDDCELEVERMTNWGQMLPTRAIIHIVIGHDFYHAGEINHIRALLQNTDRWSYS